MKVVELGVHYLADGHEWAHLNCSECSHILMLKQKQQRVLCKQEGGLVLQSPLPLNFIIFNDLSYSVNCVN